MLLKRDVKGHCSIFAVDLPTVYYYVFSLKIFVCLRELQAASQHPTHEPHVTARLIPRTSLLFLLATPREVRVFFFLISILPKRKVSYVSGVSIRRKLRK